MTRFVLTDVLLDFGRSLWNDAALREQWSGLSSKGFTSVGQFGIGFFSVFMLGDEVKVTTWPHGRGIEQQLTLHLRNRVVDRPLLLNTEEEDRLGDFGTRVSVRLKQGRESVLRKIDTYVKMKRIKVEEDFGELIAWLAPALDVDLYIKDEIEEEKLVVEADDWKSIPAAALLKRICPYLDNATILESAKRIANIVEADGTIVGRAAFTADRYTYRKTCSLVHKGMYAGECGGIIGIMQSTNNVDLARKTARPVASAIALTSWASSQIDGSSPQTIEKCADRAISLGYSSPELIVGRLDDEYVTINDLIEKLEKKEIREIVMLTEWPTCPSDISESDFEDLQIYDSVVNLTSCKPKTRYSFELPRWLEEILPDTVDAPKTIAGLIEMILKEKFSNLQAEMQDRVIGEIDYEDFETSCQVLYFDED
jgi:hypothetical protein